MDPRLLVRSKFMVSREFGTGDIPKEPMVTIVSVTKPSEEEELTRDWWLLTFKEPWAKPLKIITTHQQALGLMFGDKDTNDWIGKRIGVRAIVGTYFKKRQTAVRIVGSPDIKEARSFSVRKWGGGKDTYSLVPMPEPTSAGAPTNGHAQARPPFVPDGKVRIGPKKGTEIMLLTPEELAAAITASKESVAKAKPGATWVADVLAHQAELEADVARRAKLEQQMDAGPPPKPEAEADSPFTS